MLRLSVLSIAALTTAISVFSAQSAPSEPRKKDFVILNDDGYGTSDCLAKGSACGKIVADAWCESKGFSKSVSYRPVETGDVTHSAGASSRQIAESFVISCTE